MTFKPDLSRFGMQTLKDDDILSVMNMRVYDVAGCNETLKVRPPRPLCFSNQARKVAHIYTKARFSKGVPQRTSIAWFVQRLPQSVLRPGGCRRRYMHTCHRVTKISTSTHFTFCFSLR